VLRTDGLLPAVEHGSEWMKSSELPSPGEAVDRRMAKQGGASVPRDTRKHPDQPAHCCLPLPSSLHKSSQFPASVFVFPRLDVVQILPIPFLAGLVAEPAA